MSTIEKLFVQIFDRKRQIIEQLNHQKRLYDQHLASKLIIQGITPPPWLLNSDSFASSSSSASDLKDLNKGELISGLLLPCPQPPTTYSDASHFYDKLFPTVANGETQHDLFNATGARYKDFSDSRPGVLSQCLFKGVEDLHHPVAESPQDRVVSDTYADPDQSLARIQRSRSRQKALELRSSGKLSPNCQFEDNPPTGPRRQDTLKEGSATSAGRVLTSSVDVSLLKKQDLSCKEDRGFRSITDEMDASTNRLSSGGDCQNLSVEESIVVADSISSQKGEISRLCSESVVKMRINGSSHGKCSNSNLLTEELMENQDLSCKEEKISRCCTMKDALCDIGGVSYTVQEEYSSNPCRVSSAGRTLGICATSLVTEALEVPDDDVVKIFESNRVSDGLLGSPLQEAKGPDLYNLAGKSVELFSEVHKHTSQPGQGPAEGESGRNSIDVVPCASESSVGVYSGQDKLDANSLDKHKKWVGESAAEAASTPGLSDMMASQVVKLSPEGHILQQEVVSLERMKPSAKNKLREEQRYSGEIKLDTKSFEEQRIQEEDSAEAATTCGMSNEIADQVVNLSVQEHSCKLQVEQPRSVSSDRMKLAIGSTGEKKSQKGGKNSQKWELDTNSSSKNKPRVEKSLAEAASTYGLPAVITSEGMNVSPEENINQLVAEQPASVPSETMELATDFSGENKLVGESYLANDKFDTASSDKHKRRVGESPAEVASTHSLTDVISSKLENFSPEEHIPQLEAEQPNSLSSKRMKHSTYSRGNENLLVESLAGAVTSNTLDMVGCQPLKLSSAKRTNKLDSDCYHGEHSGKSSAESQGTCETSTDQSNTKIIFSPCTKPAERSGLNVSELATSNSEDKMNSALMRQQPKLDDAQSQAAEVQTTCFSTEVKFSKPSKLLELQTQWNSRHAESSPMSAPRGSWPQQKRRKTESVIMKSAAPKLRVNIPNIFSHGQCFAKSCATDISATKITQNDTSSEGISPENSSTMQHKEEKPSSMLPATVELNRLQPSIVSSLTGQLISTSQDFLLEADQNIGGKCNHSFSINEIVADPAYSRNWQGKADPAYSRNWQGKTSLQEENNVLDCSGSSPFIDRKAVEVEGDEPDLESFTFYKKWENAQNTGEADVNMVDNVADIFESSPTAWCQQKSLQKVWNFDYLGGSPMEYGHIVGTKGSVADLESFTFKKKCNDTQDTGDADQLVTIDLPKTTMERAKFLERLCRSASLGVPLSHFRASYSSDTKMNICHSVPTGVLEHTDLRSTSASNDSAGQLLKASDAFSKHVENSEFHGNPFSDYLPFHGAQFPWDFKGPYMSPVGKAIKAMTAKSGGSSKRGSTNPELTCFPIEESGEEDADEMDNCLEGIGSVRKSLCDISEEYTKAVALDPASKTISLESVSTEISFTDSDKQSSSNPEFACFPVGESSAEDVNAAPAPTCQEKLGSVRQPLCDLSKNMNALAVDPSSRRGSESFSSTSCKKEINNKASQNSQIQPRQSGRLRQRKQNQNFSLGTAGAKKHSESLKTRFSKPKVSVKSGLETRGGSFSEKGNRPKNIVSNINSFLPLVQQKQAAACAPVKKEVRVKALEVAEAAKRLAEKKENERKQKKEALKIERARLEQENLRRLELLKKAKEEERKKKDAEIALRKRQREEEERKEKGKKRKCEARTQLKGHEKKMPVEKSEYIIQAKDEKTDRRKEVNAEREKTVAGEQEEERTERNPGSDLATSSILPSYVGDLNINQFGTSSDHCETQKAAEANIAGCSTPKPVENCAQTICETSYEISPYCCSDEEEEEEDDSPEKKFIPKWASKSSIMMALTSHDTLDPEMIFPLSSFCSLNEVLLPRELKQR